MTARCSPVQGRVAVPGAGGLSEEKFGGFLAVTDYRDPVIAEEIRAHGFMIFPPIRFHHRTIQRDLPVAAPAPPTWMLTDAQCATVAKKRGGTGCKDIEWKLARHR